MKFPLKKIRYFAGRRALDSVRHTVSYLPLVLNRLMMDTIFCISYPVMRLAPTFKKTVLDNLRTAFGKELPRREIMRIARRSMRNVFRMPGDVLYYCLPRRHERLKCDVTISGLEHLRSSLEKGHGVIGLGAHMTGFLLLTTRLAQADIPFVILTKDQRNSAIRDTLTYLKDLNGIRYISIDCPDKGKGETLRCLANNELVYLIADERKKRDGVLAPFFGKDALTAAGPAALSLKTGAPIVPIFIARRNGSFVIDILPALNGRVDDPRPSVFEMTCRANRSIENYIRKYPDQWVWMQRRWRQ
jgi:KDO2-lipid IV(A) lauroyltransferase